MGGCDQRGQAYPVDGRARGAALLAGPFQGTFPRRYGRERQQQCASATARAAPVTRAARPHPPLALQRGRGKSGEGRCLPRLDTLLVRAGHPDKAEQLYRAALHHGHEQARGLLDNLRQRPRP
ncbi:hypothetical protein [Micromonospora sp. CPCC 206061]|uniref:hypothetical protein n=1 Tax=Micromonospora sp. CPCC 206061 TaxID=3122410 RepID=UPI002FF0DD7C